jgi:hypothetical protein
MLTTVSVRRECYTKFDGTLAVHVSCVTYGWESGSSREFRDGLPARTGISHASEPVRNNSNCILTRKCFITMHPHGRLTLRLPASASGFDSSPVYAGFVLDIVTLGKVFHEYFRFLLPILISPNVPYPSIVRQRHNRPISDRRTKWTQLHPTTRN